MLLKKSLKQIKIISSSQKIPTIIPLVIYYVVLPFLNYLDYRKNGIDYALYGNIILYALLALPLFSTWNGLLNIKGYIEDDGKELLYVNDKSSDLRIFAISAAINFICLIPLFTAYSLIGLRSELFKSMPLECLRIILSMVVFCCIAISVVILTKSIALSFGVLFLYEVLSVFSSSADSKLTTLLYFHTEDISFDIILHQTMPLVLCAVALMLVAVIIRRVRHSFI